MGRFTGLIGILVFLLLAFLLSSNRRKISLRLVGVGMLTQVLIALFMLKTPVGVAIFNWVNRFFIALMGYADRGAELLFGKLVRSQEIGATLAFQVLPVVIFVSALMGVMVHFGVIQFVIRQFARIFYRTLKITGVEAFITSLFIFMGIEAVTGVREFIRRMNDSRLFTIMVAFMSTIAGSVMAAYMGFGAQAGHLLTASLMSAPAAVVISKIMIPDEEQGESDPFESIRMDKRSGNAIEALANGTSDGLNLALQIGAMLIAFMAVVYLIDDVVGRITGVTFERLMGYALSPVALLMGIPASESVEVGKLLGVKTMFTEFLAYLQLKGHILRETLSPRTIAITTYALCGFTHFGSIAILIGGIGTLVPEKKAAVTRLAMKALVAAFLATTITAAIAGVLL